MLCVWIVVLLSFVAASETARILLIPFPFKSHIRGFTNIGEGLMDNGHDVHVVISESFPEEVKSRVKVMKFHSVHMDQYMMQQEDQTKLDKLFEEISSMNVIEAVRAAEEGKLLPMCLNFLSDISFFEKVKAMNFDYAIMDGIPHYRCAFIFVYRLQIPFFVISTLFEPWIIRNPALPSVMPLNFDKPGFSEKMTFRERFMNLLTILDWVIFPRSPVSDLNLVKQYAPELPPVTPEEVQGGPQFLLLLVEQDFVLDYPRPVMPNEVLIGGLATKPAKPLPKDLQAFMDSAGEHGVIVVSFGSMSINLPDRVNENMFEAFRNIQQHIIWRYLKKPPSGLPPRIRLSRWLPQNDLLAHPNTKLFITHCGSSGQFEAVYHAVPMINMPMFGDQPFNALRSEYHRYSITLDLTTFTAKDLIKAVETVTTNSSYSERIKKASAVFHSKMETPRERALNAIEHAIKHGTAHLRSYALDMPLYQFYMLDVLALFLILSHFLPLLIWCLCNRFVKRN